MKPILIFIVLLLKKILSQLNNNINLTLNEELKYQLEQNQIQYYVINSLDLDLNYDLVIRVIPVDDNNEMFDPDLFVSLVIKS